MNIISSPGNEKQTENNFQIHSFNLNEKEKKFIDVTPFYCEQDGEYTFILTFTQTPANGNFRDWWLKSSLYLKILPTGTEIYKSGDEKYLMKKNASCNYRFEMKCKIKKDDFIEISIKADKSTVDGIQRQPIHISEIKLQVLINR